MKQKPLILWLVVAGVLIIPPISFGHHGTNISYDHSKQMTINGVVTEFRYANPHAQLYFDVKDDKGNVARWSGEVGWSIGSMVRSGWTKKRSEEALKPGTSVRMIIAPGRSGGPVGLIYQIFNDKGEQIFESFRNPEANPREAQ